MQDAEDAGEAGAAEEVARHGRGEWGRGGIAKPDQDGVHIRQVRAQA